MSAVREPSALSQAATRASTLRGSAHEAADDPRRVRKREVDRACQRKSRQRTKSRIAHLEELVEELSQRDSSGLAAGLAAQLNHARAENQLLVQTLQRAQGLIQGCLGSLGQGDGAAEQGMSAENGEQGTEPPSPPLDTSSQAPGDPSGLGSNLTRGPFQSHGQQPSTPKGARHPSSPADATPPADPERYPLCARCDPLQPMGPCTSKWAVAHSALGLAPIPLAPSVLAWEDSVSGDLPVRAVAEGWPAAELRAGGRLPPLWAKLRTIDQAIFPDLDRVDRLAILVTMHLLLRYNAGGAPAARGHRVPAWYLTRPPREQARSYAVDFLAWPGMRVRFALSPHRYCSDRFWRVFNASVGIAWSRGFDACVVRGRDGSYGVHPDFSAHISNIRAWTMQPDFFAAYPEFRAAICTQGSIMRSLAPVTHQPVARWRASRHGSMPAALALPGQGDAGGDDPATEIALPGQGDADGEDPAAEMGPQPPRIKLQKLREAGVLPDHDLTWLDEALQCS